MKTHTTCHAYFEGIGRWDWLIANLRESFYTYMLLKLCLLASKLCEPHSALCWGGVIPHSVSSSIILRPLWDRISHWNAIWSAVWETGLYSAGAPPQEQCFRHMLLLCFTKSFLCKCWGPKLRPSCLHTKCFSNTILLLKNVHRNFLGIFQCQVCFVKRMGLMFVLFTCYCFPSIWFTLLSVYGSDSIWKLDNWS